MKRIFLLILSLQMIAGCALFYSGPDLNYMLISAAKRGDITAVQDALEKGADINRADEDVLRGETALYLAASRGHIDVVKFLLEKGADVNGTTEKGETALMGAAWRYIDIVRLLLDRGADINKRDSHGGSVFSAALMDKKEVLKLLLEHDVDTDIISDALLTASYRGFIGAAKLFIKNGADVNKKDFYGGIGLIYAAREGHTEMVRLLIENGADVNAGEADGVTPLMAASWNGYGDIEKLLIEKGAQVKEKESDAVVLHGFAYQVMIDALLTIDFDTWIVPTVPIIFGDMEQLEDVPDDQFQKMKKNHEKLCHLTDVYQSPKNTDVWLRKSDQKKVLFLSVSIEKAPKYWRYYYCDWFLSGNRNINTADEKSRTIEFDRGKGEFVFQEEFVLEEL